MVRRAIIFILMFVIPAVLWALVISFGWLPPRWLPEIARYALAGAMLLPGVVGIGLMQVRRSTKWSILPFYCMGMGMALLWWGMIFACVVLHDCP